jgi:hypothetical protein
MFNSAACCSSFDREFTNKKLSQKYRVKKIQMTTKISQPSPGSGAAAAAASERLSETDLEAKCKRLADNFKGILALC